MARIADAVRPRVADVRPRIADTVRPWTARAATAARPLAARIARPQAVRTWQYTAGAAAVGLALAAGVVTAAGPWDSGQRTAEREWAAAQEGTGGADHGRTSDSSGSSGAAAGAPRPAPSAPAVLAGLGGAGALVRSAPGTPALAALLDPLLRDPALGEQHTAVVADLTTGRRLYGTGADVPLTPASTTKIATAVAALSALGADHRIATRAVLEPDTRELILVGGGDPTLTARADTGGWASLRTLAASTAAALKKRGLTEVTLSYDTSLYAGPVLHPIGVNENLAPVTPLMTDEGRTDDSAAGPARRSADPAADAIGRFADLLHDQGVRTTSPGPSKATARGQTLATVTSPPLSDLVERMLTNSDNDIAEHLARQIALATGVRPDFPGGGEAIRRQLAKLGLPLTGAVFHDGSGLDRTDRLTADLLTSLLAQAADPAHPGLRPVLTGLPVAGFTGTLTSRYTDGAAGLIRAKTGTLTGVNTLAGTAVDPQGHLLAFAFLASGTTDPGAAQRALDRTATALAGPPPVG